MVTPRITPLGSVDVTQKTLQGANAPEPKSLDSDFFKAAFSEATMTDEVTDFYKLGQMPIDPDFVMTKEMKQNHMANYGTAQAEYLESAKSEGDYKFRLARLEERKKDQEVLSEYGTTGVVATFAVGFLDPVGWGVGLATGGVGKAVQMGRLGKAALAATTVGAEGYALGKFEQAYNPYMTDADVMMQTMFSVGLGGAIGGITGGTKAASRADEIDEDSFTSAITEQAESLNRQADEIERGYTIGEDLISVRQSEEAIVDIPQKPSRTEPEPEPTPFITQDDAITTLYGDIPANKRAALLDTYNKRQEFLNTGASLDSTMNALKAERKNLRRDLDELEQDVLPPDTPDIDARRKSVEQAYKVFDELDAKVAQARQAELDMPVRASKKRKAPASNAEAIAKMMDDEVNKAMEIFTPEARSIVRKIWDYHKKELDRAKGALEKLQANPSKKRSHQQQITGVKKEIGDILQNRSRSLDVLATDPKYLAVKPMRVKRPETDAIKARRRKIGEIEGRLSRLRNVGEEAPFLAKERSSLKRNWNKMTEAERFRALMRPEPKPKADEPEAPSLMDFTELDAAGQPPSIFFPKLNSYTYFDEMGSAVYVNKDVAEVNHAFDQLDPYRQLEAIDDAMNWRDSVGAARADRDEFDLGITTDEADDAFLASRYTATTENVYIKSIQGTSLARATQALYTTLATSQSQYVRGFGMNLFENPQGASAGRTIEGETASITAAVMGRMFRAAGGGASTRNDAFLEMLRTNKRNIVSGVFDEKLKDNFNRDVLRALDNDRVYADSPDYIKAAADSLRTQYKTVLEEAQKSGVKGFEGFEGNPNYFQKVLKGDKLVNMAHKFGQSKVLATISKGYQDGKYKIKPEAADKLAELMFAKLTRARGMVSDIGAPNHKKDLETLREYLDDLGIDKDTIDSYLSLRIDEDEIALLSDRSKNSLYPDINAGINTKNGDLRYLDLIENDVESLMESYIREMSANIAMKRTVGTSSYKSTMRLLESVRNQAQRGDSSTLDLPTLDKEITLLKDGIDMIYGRSINKDKDSSIAKNVGRLRQFNSILRLQAVGLTNLTELPRVIAQHGLATAFKTMPFTQRARIKELGHEGFIEADKILHFVGEDHRIQSMLKDVDMHDELAAGRAGMISKAGKVIDQALASGQRLSGIVNLFRATQGTGERMSMRANYLNLVEGKITTQQARDAGWIREGESYYKVEGDEGFLTKTEVNILDELYAFMKEYPKTGKVSDEPNAKSIKMLNWDKLEEVNPELSMAIRRGMLRLTSREMQRMHVGETPASMHRWLGGLVTQFLTFPYASLSKQLLHDSRSGDRSVAALTMIYGAGMVAASQGLKIGLQSMNSDKDFDELWEKKFGDPVVAGYNILTNMGTTSSLGLLGDVLATLGAMPDSLLASSSNGWQGGNRYEVPVASLYKDVQGIVSGAKGDTSKDREKMFKSIQNLVPFANTIGIKQAIQATYTDN